MDFKIEEQGAQILLSGQIDSVNSVDFEQVLNAAVKNAGNAFEVDCTGLEYISSSGLRVFIALQKRCNADGLTMQVSHLQPHIAEIFEMTGFSKIISLT